MKGIQFLLILFLLPGVPLFQMDQAIDFDWLVCENSLVIKSEVSETNIDHHLWFDSKPPSPFLNQVKIFFQMRNTSSVLFSYFEGTSPFCRPPPSFYPSLS
jgi:hypothetical protein